MKKQICYPKFVPRLFAAILDATLLLLIITPIMNFVSRMVMIYSFRNFFVEFGIDITNHEDVLLALQSPEFMEYITAKDFFFYIITVNFISICLTGIYFICFWHLYGSTPGKIIMRMRIVSANSYSRPTLWSLMKRYIFYVTALVGIWSIPFSKKGQALHDKLSNTVVIKK